MAFGQFTLEINGEQQDGTGETKTRLYLVPQGSGTLRDPDGDQFKFPSKFAKPGGQLISLPYSVDLFTNSTSGASTTLGYEGYVATEYGRVPFTFAAPAAGTVVNLVDLTDSVVTTISDLAVFTPYATTARPAASVGVGATYFDTTLNRLVTSDGTNWRDQAGTIV